MSDPAQPVRRLLVAADMERYSDRDNPGQYRAQQMFRAAMAAAVTEIGLRRDDWWVQPNGDGELAVLPAGTPEPIVVGDLVPALDRILRERNASLLPAAKVRLRVAIHQGLAHLDGANGVPGEAAVAVCRLVDAEPLRHALRSFPGAGAALIVSRGVFEDVVRHGYRGLRPERFAPVRIRAKQYESEAWIHVPDEDATALTWPDPAPPPETRPQPQTRAATPETECASGAGAGSTYHISGVQSHGPTVFGSGTAIGTVHGSWPGGPGRAEP